jgi:hypothetical protein
MVRWRSADTRPRGKAYRSVEAADRQRGCGHRDAQQRLTPQSKEAVAAAPPLAKDRCVLASGMSQATSERSGARQQFEPLTRQKKKMRRRRRPSTEGARAPRSGAAQASGAKAQRSALAARQRQPDTARARARRDSNEKQLRVNRDVLRTTEGSSVSLCSAPFFTLRVVVCKKCIASKSLGESHWQRHGSAIGKGIATRWQHRSTAEAPPKHLPAQARVFVRSSREHLANVREFSRDARENSWRTPSGIRSELGRATENLPVGNASRNGVAAGVGHGVTDVAVTASVTADVTGDSPSRFVTRHVTRVTERDADRERVTGRDGASRFVTTGQLGTSWLAPAGWQQPNQLAGCPRSVPGHVPLGVPDLSPRLSRSRFGGEGLVAAEFFLRLRRNPGIDVRRHERRTSDVRPARGRT